MLRKLTLLIVVGLLSVSAVSYVMAQDGGSDRVVGGDEASLRNMLDRIVNASYLPASERTTVYVGEVNPDAFPFEMPIPEDATVIGTLVRTSLYAPNEVYFNTSQSAQAVVDFYDAALADAFTRLDDDNMMFGQTGGFPSANRPMNTVYCHNETNGTFNILSSSLEGTTDVTVAFLDNVVGNICETDPQSGARLPRAMALLPELTIPEGAEIEPYFYGGGGGGDFEASSTAKLLTETLTASDIADFYIREIESQGWDTRESESTAFGGWAVFTLQDENGERWQTVLTLTPSPEDAAFNAHLRIQKQLD